MAFLTINSDNPDMSHVIAKNPASGMSIRTIRSGQGFGWFPNSSDMYYVLFKDGLDEDSYSQGDFNYLSQEPYCNAMAYLNIITEFFRSTTREKHEKDSGNFHNQVCLEQVRVRSGSAASHFSKHVEGLQIERVPVEGTEGVERICFAGKVSLQELLNITCLFCLFQTGYEGAYLTKVNEDFVSKYAGLINKLELPYFLRYLFARNYFRDKNTFDKFAPLIETENIKLAHGDTAMQRLRAIEQHLSFDLPIVDIGAGEGLFALNFPKKMFDTYHAIDVDEDIIGTVGRKAEKRGYDVATYISLDQYEDSDPVDVLMVEVIEHMPKEEAEALIKQALSLNFRNLVITTPNRSFNKHYLIEDKFRHEDHKWEMNTYEFENFIFDIVEACDQLKSSVHFIKIGDRVKAGAAVAAETPTQGVIISHNVTQRRLIATVGIPASGKSTFAKRIVADNPETWVEVNRDNIRFNKATPNWKKYKFSRAKEEKVTKRAFQMMDKAAEQERNIIVSDTNLSEKTRDRLKEWAEENNYIFQVKEFDVSLEEAVARDNQREGGVGYQIIHKMYQKWLEYKGRERYTPDSTKPEAYVFDVDGTLAKMEGRSPYEWEKVGEDSLQRHVAAVAEGVKKGGFKIIILSGRDGCCEDQTKEWLKKNNIWFDEFFIREEGSYEKDTVVKESIFWDNIAPHYNVLGVFDDRPSVCRMWREIGVNTFQLGNPYQEF